MDYKPLPIGVDNAASYGIAFCGKDCRVRLVNAWRRFPLHGMAACQEKMCPGFHDCKM